MRKSDESRQQLGPKYRSSLLFKQNVVVTIKNRFFFFNENSFITSNAPWQTWLLSVYQREMKSYSISKHCKKILLMDLLYEYLQIDTDTKELNE